MIKEPFYFYENNELKVEGVNVKKIVEEQGSPVYIYSKASLEAQLNSMKDALSDLNTLICYSMKVNNNVNVINFFVKNGCGVDIVSGGELYKAYAAGADMSKVVYSGVAKTEREIYEAISNNILMLNVESTQELERINKIAENLGKKVNVSIRVNPGVDAKTHPHITTGLKNNKFGIDHDLVIDVFKFASEMKNINLVGIDCHIGSQLLDVSPFRDAMKVISSYYELLKKESISIKYIDLGGGLGIPYLDGQKSIDPHQYANVIKETFTNYDEITFILEPGRYLTAQAGILVTEIQYIKRNSINKKFVIVDTGMNSLMRPALYDAHHEIIPVELKADSDKFVVDVVGPICESTDFFAKDRAIPKVKQGDLLAITDTGAYGMALASHYNSHSLPVEVMVTGNKYEVIRYREKYNDLLKFEVLHEDYNPDAMENYQFYKK